MTASVAIPVDGLHRAPARLSVNPAALTTPDRDSASPRHRIAGVIQDVLLLTLMVYLIPLVIIAAGMPFALLLRLIRGIAASL